MAGDTLTFEYNGDPIFPPFEAVVGVRTITVTNNGTETLTGLGFYIRPATSQGDLDKPATYPPETDYQEMLTWGTRTDLGITANGGLIVTLDPDGTGPVAYYVHRDHGANAENKIRLMDLDPGESTDIDIEFETPPSFTTRRFYLDIGID